MADQDAQDINQMMSATSDVVVAAPKKSKFLWVVLSCVVVGVGLGVVVYQQSLKSTIKPTTTPRPTSVVKSSPTVIASPLASPLAPEVNVVNAAAKTIPFPKGGKLRFYFQMGSWNSLGIILKDSAGTHDFTIPAGNPGTAMKIFDTGYTLPGAETITLNTYLGTDKTKLSIGWAVPANNKCGFNGFGVVDISALITYATAQAKGEPLVSTECWGDYSPNPADPSSKDFNDYTLIVSYTPSSTTASPSPAGSSTASSTPTPSATASPSPSVAASPSPSTSTVTGTAMPVASPRVAMPDTTDGTPVTGVFEVTVGTVSVGLILLVLGLFGLLAL